MKEPGVQWAIPSAHPQHHLALLSVYFRSSGEATIPGLTKNVTFPLCISGFIGYISIEICRVAS